MATYGPVQWDEIEFGNSVFRVSEFGDVQQWDSQFSWWESVPQSQESAIRHLVWKV